jgi:hypothetical protein
MMKKFLTAGSLVAAMALGACAPDEDLNEANTEIIGGVNAFTPALNAIGTVGFVDDGAFGYSCSAVLIGPSTVLTAKQCILDLTFGTGPLVNITEMYFAVGPDAFAPDRVVELVDADVSPEYGTGTNLGFTGLGADVGVMYLKEPITDIEPMKIVPWKLAARHLGWKYTTAGFGEKDAIDALFGQFEAKRALGTLTLRALKGQFFQKAYDGDYDTYLYDLVQQYGADIIEANLDIVQDWWQNTPLLEGSEAWMGMASGDAQTCYGDTGGPLVRKYSVTGETLVYGVSSANWYSSNLACDKGTIVATFNDKTRRMLDKSLTWKDPCRVDGTLYDAVGTCSDSQVATRCSAKWEGKRRFLQFDCASAGMVCGADQWGYASCVSPDTRVAAPSNVTRGTVPSLEQVRASVVKATRGEYNPSLKRFFDALNN